jgi:hypothetical protein
MARGRRLGAEQIVTKLRQIKVLQGQGKNIAVACKEVRSQKLCFLCRRKVSKILDALPNTPSFPSRIECCVDQLRPPISKLGKPVPKDAI